MVIDLAAAALDDEDIFPADALLDFNARLANCELAQQNLRGRNAEMVADGSRELRVRVPAEHDNVSDHDEGLDGCGAAAAVGAQGQVCGSFRRWGAWSQNSSRIRWHGG